MLCMRLSSLAGSATGDVGLHFLGASEGCSRGVAGLSAHEAPVPLCYSRSRPVIAQVETPQTVSTDVFSKGGCAVRWHRLILSSEDLRWTCCGVLGLFTIH